MIQSGSALEGIVVWGLFLLAFAVIAIPSGLIFRRVQLRQAEIKHENAVHRIRQQNALRREASLRDLEGEIGRR